LSVRSGGGFVALKKCLLLKFGSLHMIQFLSFSSHHYMREKPDKHGLVTKHPPSAEGFCASADASQPAFFPPFAPVLFLNPKAAVPSGADFGFNGEPAACLF
jgi:hypothetical protein